METTRSYYLHAPSSNKAILEGITRYSITRKIGVGGMATVYHAIDKVLNRNVALKIMHEHLLTSPGTLKRFTTEAQTVASLSHENIIKIFDIGEIESRPYLVMEYIEGVSLSQLLEQSGILPNLVAVEICRQILLGLQCAHAQGIFHRDIKPDNIMIDKNGVVKVLDFGIAYIVNNESLTLAGAFVGSPYSLSPEQAQSKPLTPATDIFSLGVLLYIALSGKRPFHADNAATIIHSILHDIPPPVYKNNPQVLFWLSDIVDTFLIKDGVKRPNAQGGLALFEKECEPFRFSEGKGRLTRFIENQESQRAIEQQELYKHYLTLSRIAIKDRKHTVALRSLEQAKAFGQISKDDAWIQTSYTLHRWLRWIGIVVIVAAVCGLGLYGLMKLSIRGEKNQERGKLLLSGYHYDKENKSAMENVMMQTTVINSEKQKQYYQLKNKNIFLPFQAESETTEVNRRNLKKQVKVNQYPKGFVVIKTNPPWAKVYIDEIERGTTPATTVYMVPCGTHKIRIIKEGFSEYTKPFCVNKPDSILLKVSLEPLPFKAR